MKTRQQDLSRERAVPNRLPSHIIRAVFDEVCTAIPLCETTIRARVASAILDHVKHGDVSIDELRIVGRKALLPAPTMWPTETRDLSVDRAFRDLSLPKEEEPHARSE